MLASEHPVTICRLQHNLGNSSIKNGGVNFLVVSIYKDYIQLSIRLQYNRLTIPISKFYNALRSLYQSLVDILWRVEMRLMVAVTASSLSHCKTCHSQSHFLAYMISLEC